MDAKMSHSFAELPHHFVLPRGEGIPDKNILKLTLLCWNWGSAECFARRRQTLSDEFTESGDRAQSRSLRCKGYLYSRSLSFLTSSSRAKSSALAAFV